MQRGRHQQAGGFYRAVCVFCHFLIDSETNSYYQGLDNIVYCMNLHNRMRWTGDLSNQLNSHTLCPKLRFHKNGRTGEYLMRWYLVKKYQKVSNVFRKTQTFRVYVPSSVGEKPLPGEHVSVQMMVRDKPFVFSPSSFYYKETQKNHGTPLFANSGESSREVWCAPYLCYTAASPHVICIRLI